MWGWLQSFLRWYPASVRQLGFVEEIHGIRQRYRHCREFWAEHLQQCHATILTGMARCRSHRKAVILGAGLLHDVPIASLSQQFREVILVDVVHPLHSRWATRRWKNVRHFCADVTATLDEVYRAGFIVDYRLPKSEPKWFIDDPEVDFTVSVNLLSQLPCMPMSYLRRMNAKSEPELEAFARELIEAHLTYLNQLPGCVTLITDIERHTLNLMGHNTETRDLLYGLHLDREGKTWTWKLAPAPEVHPTLSYYRKVIGIADWK